MLTRIKQVHSEFFKLFHNLQINLKGVPTKVPVRYAKKSSEDYTEEQDNQVYPCIAIQDYPPVPKDDWFIDMRPYFGGLSSRGLKGFLYQRPIWMEFRYDVSVVSKSSIEFMDLQDYFLSHFVYRKQFLFNQKLTGDDAVGDVVPFSVRATDIPRTDGVHETNYEFTLSVWVYPVDAIEVDTITGVVLNLIAHDGRNKADLHGDDSDTTRRILYVVVSEEEYEDLVTRGEINKDVFYFILEE